MPSSLPYGHVTRMGRRIASSRPSSGRSRCYPRLVNDLLDVSRVTSGKVALQREPVDLAALSTASSGRRASRRASASFISLVVGARARDRDGDAVRLLNRSSPPAEQRDEVHAAARSLEVALTHDRSTAKVRVSDSGVGIRRSRCEDLRAVRAGTHEPRPVRREGWASVSRSCRALRSYTGAQ